MGISQTVFTFDRPDERVLIINRLLPMLSRDDSVEIDGESRLVRTAILSVNSSTGDVILYIRLR